eukprot:8732582-Karenia_brevis.AAC.1
MDLTRRKMQQLVRTAVRSNLIWAVHIATPCASFSRARDRRPGPPPLRSNEHPYGLPNLQSKKDIEKTQGDTCLS